MPATLAVVDAELARLRAAAAALSTTLVDLDGDPLKCSLETTDLRGRTRQRWAVGAAALAELWRDYTALTGVLDLATAQRGTERRPGEDVVRRTAELVLGASVTLDTSTVPVAQRTLLGPTQRTVRVTPESLLPAMERAFATVRGVLAEVAAASAPLQARLAASVQLHAEAEAELDAQPDQRSVPPSARAALHRLHGQLDALAVEVAADPLGCSGSDLDALDAALQAARTRAAPARCGRASWRACRPPTRSSTGSARPSPTPTPRRATRPRC